MRRAKSGNSEATPAAIPETLTEFRNRIIQAIQASEDQTIAKLSKGGFQIPGQGV